MKKWCCGGPATVWKVSRDGEILWRKNHFAATPADELHFMQPYTGGIPTGSFWDDGIVLADFSAFTGERFPACSSIDVDQFGNVFAAGNWNRLLRDSDIADWEIPYNGFGDDQPPAEGRWDEPRADRIVVARSYSSRGMLRWSWDNAPYHMPIGAEYPETSIYGPMTGVIRAAEDGGAHLLFGRGFYARPPLSVENLFGRNLSWSTCSPSGQLASRRTIQPLNPEATASFVFYGPIAGSDHEFSHEHRPRGQRWFGGVELVNSDEYSAVSLYYHSLIYDHAGNLLWNDGMDHAQAAWNPEARISAISFADGRGYVMGNPVAEGGPRTVTTLHAESNSSIHTTASNDRNWACNFDIDEIGGGVPNWLLANDDYVVLLLDAQTNAHIQTKRYFTHGKWALWRATDGEFLGFGNVGDPVPVIDGERLPFERSLIGWHIAGGGFTERDGRIRWRPKMAARSVGMTTGIHELVIDDDENVLIATELGQLEIERL